MARFPLQNEQERSRLKKLEKWSMKTTHCTSFLIQDYENAYQKQDDMNANHYFTIPQCF